MGYVGDDVMKNWIKINYHIIGGNFEDELAKPHVLHEDNCRLIPLLTASRLVIKNHILHILLASRFSKQTEKTQLMR